MPSTSDNNLLKDKKRFDSWRAHRPKQGPIPNRISKRAVAHVKEYGLERVSREFGFNHSKLKEKLQELERTSVSHDLDRPAFVEFDLPKRQLNHVCNSSRLPKEEF
jgi:hypothetical protein